MTATKAVRHIGIVVSDLERSLSFYRDLLGLKVVRVMNESGEHMDSMLSLKNVRLTTIKMTADSGSTLVELLEFKSHPCYILREREACSIGPSHVAFTVDDLDTVYHRLSEAGVRFNAQPQRSSDGYAKFTFCLDPDGTLIELVEVLDPSVLPPSCNVEER